MKRTLMLLLLINTAIIAVSQNAIDVKRIQLEKHWGINRFVTDSTKVNVNQLLIAIEDNEQAYNMLNSAQESKFFGKLFCAVGGVLIVYPIVSCIWDDTPNVPMSVAGCCMVAISVPIFINYNKQSREAMRLISGDVEPPKDKTTSKRLEIGTTRNGIGLSMRF